MTSRYASPLGQNLLHEVLLLLKQQTQKIPTPTTFSRVRPLVVVPGGLFTSQVGRWPTFGSDAPTIDALRRVGANPLSLASIPLIEGDPLCILTDEKAYDEAFDVIWSFVTQINIQGLCLPGGGDLNSCLYYQQAGPQTDTGNTWQDLWERYLLLIGWVLRWPMFGICRGLQHMNAILGGGLIQDLRAQWRSLWTSSDYKMLPMLRHQPLVRNRTPDTFCFHEVYVNMHSKLARVLKVDGAAGAPFVLDACLSQHHQAIGVVMPDGTTQGFIAEGLKIGATSSDGVIEAIECQERLDDVEARERWFVGVQWHPEWMNDNFYAQELFRGFTQECRFYTPLSKSQLQELKPAVRAWIRQMDKTSWTPERQQRIAGLSSIQTRASRPEAFPIHTIEPLSRSNRVLKQA